MTASEPIPLHPEAAEAPWGNEGSISVLRPRIFSHLAGVGTVGAIDFRESGGARFFFNCNDPAAGKMAFSQRLNIEQVETPDLQFALDAEVLNNGYAWSSLEYHVPLATLQAHHRAHFRVLLRAHERDTISLGYGGILDKGRGFECFELEDFSVGRQFKRVSLEFEFDALPLDEIENDRLVLALYLTKTGVNRLTILDLALDLG